MPKGAFRPHYRHRSQAQVRLLGWPARSIRSRARRNPQPKGRYKDIGESTQTPEAILLVKHTGLFAFRIDQQCIGAHMNACLQAAVDSQADQHSAYASSAVVNTPRQAAHSKAGYRVARQLLFLGITELVRTNLRRAQGVEPQNFAGAGVINQYEY